jgi:hypothetical protein
MTLEENLTFIKNTYHEMILDATYVWGGRPEVIAGIMMRETNGGLSPLLDVQGPAGRGDGGHGHGLMQIDDRWHSAFTSSDRWSNPKENIKYGAYVLRVKTQFFEKRQLLLTDITHEQLGIASYNAGESRVLKAFQRGDDPDIVTTHGNYSRMVLQYAEIYRNL